MRRDARIWVVAVPLLLAGLGGGLAGGHKSAAAQAQDPAGSVLPRGKRLVLKDGSNQIVRSYERNGDRVRYYSLERSAWEELPAALVDWDATAKYEAERGREAEALAKKVHAEEGAARIETAMDIDASLPVAPGVFLPPGEGLFVVDGRAVTQLEQVGTETHTDKKQVLKQVIVPVPIVPGKRNLEIPGAKARVRITTGQPEFYLREAPPDPERASRIRKSSRPVETGPEVELIRAAVKGSKRRVGSISRLLGQEMDTRRDSIAMQRWEVAPNVFRFTVGQTLAPGEYVLAEFLPEGINLYVWDFGVDAAPVKNPAATAQEPQK
ncbi:MAG TPA: hypothetical protein VHE23_05805 [Candidatus Acidoferrales bacterium]|nr:hypothetical protein [Candidatus Acidoferrales bacterium]